MHARDVIAQLSGIADRVGVGKLECNPFGQYGWLEDALDLPITAAIADILEAGEAPWTSP